MVVVGSVWKASPQYMIKWSAIHGSFSWNPLLQMTSLSWGCSWSCTVYSYMHGGMEVRCWGCMEAWKWMKTWRSLQHCAANLYGDTSIHTHHLPCPPPCKQSCDVMHSNYNNAQHIPWPVWSRHYLITTTQTQVTYINILECTMISGPACKLHNHCAVEVHWFYPVFWCGSTRSAFPYCLQLCCSVMVWAKYCAFSIQKICIHVCQIQGW